VSALGPLAVWNLCFISFQNRKALECSNPYRKSNYDIFTVLILLTVKILYITIQNLLQGNMKIWHPVSIPLSVSTYREAWSQITAVYQEIYKYNDRDCTRTKLTVAGLAQ
jgi:hypothetical protein